MESLLNRLASFVNWNIDIAYIYPTELASAGFFFTGYRDEIECFKCHERLSNFLVGEDAVLKRILLHSSCQLVAPKKELNSYAESFGFTGMQLDKDGACNIKDNNVESADRQDSFANTSMQNTSISNYQQLIATPLAIDHPELAINAFDFKLNKNVASNINDMKFEKFRLDSFLDWPKNDVIKPQLLARDGFFYMGTGDRVQCAFCKGILRTWEPGDDPEVEHTRHYPDCGFVLGNDVGNVPLSVDPRRKINAIRVS